MMNQEDIFKKIGQILNELNEQYQYLAQNAKELNELELELFLANASFLTDHVHIVRKLNKKTEQKILPEHAGVGSQPIAVQTAQVHQPEEKIEQEPVIPVKVFEESSVNTSSPNLDEDIFTLDKEPANFEFILNENPGADKFDFEEKSVGDIFDRPLSKEEEYIIAQKQKLRELDSLKSELPEEDEIGPEPFLVSEPLEEIQIPEIPVHYTKPVEHTQPEKAPESVPDPVPVPVKETPYVAPLQNNESEKAPVYVPKPIPTDAKSAEIPFSAPIVSSAGINQNQVEEQSKSKPTLNDLLSGSSSLKGNNTGKSRAEITDLKQAISLNDRMRYIKDLFNGYNLAYAEAIDLLNKMPDFKTADQFLQQNYAVKNNWESKPETTEQFYDLLNQRFPAK